MRCLGVISIPMVLGGPGTVWNYIRGKHPLLKDNTITSEEVAAAVAEAEGCRADEVNVRVIRSAPRCLGSVWLRCPLTAAREINGREDARLGGKIIIGWSAARVFSLSARQLQCFRCMESGHVRKDYTSKVDRSERCYRCGAEGHRACD